MPPNSVLNESENNLFFKVYHPNRACRAAGGKNLLQSINDDQFAAIRQDNPHYPFANKDEWELVKWLTDASLTQQQIDAFLRLGYVRKSLVSYKCWFSSLFRSNEMQYLSSQLVTYVVASRCCRKSLDGNTKPLTYLQGTKPRPPLLFTGETLSKLSKISTGTPSFPLVWSTTLTIYTLNLHQEIVPIASS